MLDVLKRTLDAGPTGDLAFICTAQGKPYVKEALGNAFKDACRAAGILDKSAHGLRKAAATRAADNGATAHELMAIFGWKDIKEAEIYTRAANRTAGCKSHQQARTVNKRCANLCAHLCQPPQKSMGCEANGALGGTRTPTMLLTATSRQRVYQFRHERKCRPAKGWSRVNGADVTNRPWGDKARRVTESGVFAVGFLPALSAFSVLIESEPRL